MQKIRECLLIDDDLDDQEIFRLCIKKISGDINCTFINDGVEALERLADSTYAPDFIFLDLNMPKMNGIECLRALKSLNHLKQTKIFMYSTTSEHEVVAESRRIGAEDFIMKPAKTVQLKEKLATIFSVASQINETNA